MWYKACNDMRYMKRAMTCGIERAMPCGIKGAMPCGIKRAMKCGIKRAMKCGIKGAMTLNKLLSPLINEFIVDNKSNFNIKWKTNKLCLFVYACVCVRLGVCV